LVTSPVYFLFILAAIGGWLAATLLDVSGVLTAGALAATGLAILPYRKRTIMANLRARHCH
jgi:hypothetical protein